MFWGLTPAVDLVQQYNKIYQPNQNTQNDACVKHILIICGTDCRHLFKTLSQRYKTPGTSNTKLIFYIIEPCMEAIAKQLLLARLALTPAHQMGATQKTRIFMDLYGNTLIRPASARYLTSAAANLLNAITDYRVLESTTPHIRIDVTHRERDYLATLFQYWCGSELADFDICKQWDGHVRHDLGVRYETREGAFDWDLHMRFNALLRAGRGLCEVRAHEYRTFRARGVAYTFLEADVSCTNRTLVCAVTEHGTAFVHCGYRGDTRTGPFVAYNRNRTEEKNDRVTDVTERHVREILHELEYGTPYTHRPTSDTKMGAIVIAEPSKIVTDWHENGGTRTTRACDTKMTQCFRLDGAEVRFMSPVAGLRKMRYKNAYKSLFDMIYVGGGGIEKYFTPELFAHSAADRCVLMLENRRFHLQYRDADLEKFHKETLNKCVDGLRLNTIDFDALKDDYALYYK